MRLNLGCGGITPGDWVNIDRAGDPPIVIHDLRDRLPFDDMSCEGAVAHHVLSLFAEESLLTFLEEVHRVLALGAVFRISDADLTAGVQIAMNGNKRWFAEPRPTLEETVGFYVTQGGARRTLVTPTRLCGMLEDVGFPHTIDHAMHGTMGPSWMRDLDSRFDESFYVEAIR